MTRRQLLATAALASAEPGWTKFPIGCMTLPYAPFPFDRALEGIARAGYRHVGWGTTHPDSGGVKRQVIDAGAPPAEARRLAARGRAAGLAPVVMFAQISVEAPGSVPVHTRRIEQAASAGIPFLITFGHTAPGADEVWIRNLKQLGAVARAHGVTVTIKQHGGNTGTGRQCARIIARVEDEGVRLCYDAGNVLDYEKADPIADIQSCWRDIRSFAIKDHRNTPRSQDCGPGFGEIDHYKLLAPVLRTSLTIPLVCENIFAPYLPRPRAPEGVDALAKRAREYLEAVVAGLQSPA
jgi:sugar phosphate isomerase/epimerase